MKITVKNLIPASLILMAIMAFKLSAPSNSGTPTILIRGPYLQAATSTSIVIRWRTETLAGSRVRYGATLNNLSSVANGTALVTEHETKLTGLTPHTKYFYAIEGVKDTLQIGPNNYFYTLPTPSTTGFYRIGIVGDCGTNTVVQHGTRDALVKYLGNNDLDAWILLGDNAYANGIDAQYQSNFFNVYKDPLLKKYPLFPAPGNHDYDNNKPMQLSHEVAYYKNFTVPVNGESGGLASHNPSYYSFDVGNIHFLSLDSYGIEENTYRLSDTLSPQVKWVKQDLEANKNKGWVIAYWHHPPYTMGSHNSDTESELVKIRTNFIRILERYGVDLIICGHSHVYERSKLMKGYYGMENDFDNEYNVGNSSGLSDGTTESCPYIKDSKTNSGTVYVVTGSAGQLGKSKPSFPHAAMYYSNIQIAGTSILEVQENRLDFKWICTDGVIRDHFTMMKDVNKKTTVSAKSGEEVKLTASFIGDYSWTPGGQTTRTITVPAKGAATYQVKDKKSCVTDVFQVKVEK